MQGILQGSCFFIDFFFTWISRRKRSRIYNTDNGGVATYSASIGYLPCSETIAEMDAIKEKRQDANYQKAFEQLDYADNQHMVSQPNNGDIANLITAMMEATLYDFEDVTEQMNTMNDEAKATLADLQ